MDTIYEVDDLAELRQLQWQARLGLQLTATPHPLTSPMFLRDFLASKLPVLTVHCDCASHELLEVSTQSYYTDNQVFLSLTCNRCRYHFYVAGDSQHVQSWGPEHRHHMLVSCSQESTNDVKIRTAQKAHDDTTSNARFICIAGDCLFNVKIFVVPWRLSPMEMAKLSDKSRVGHNLELAIAEDADRYSNLLNSQNIKSDTILRQYLNDALKINNDTPLRVNKRNKRFFVSMRNDFDNLLRFLGFYEGIDPTSEEPCWYIPPPEKEQNPTRVHTLRARIEDALMEIEIVFAGGNTIHAWDKLLGTFQANYPRVPTELHTTFESIVSEDDLNLLGCLSHYPPEFFSWAAILLAQRRPRDRNKYLDAGVRCIASRSDDASIEIIMYKSRFDDATPMGVQVEEAYAFYNASPDSGMTSDWFLAKYYEMAKSCGSDEFKAQALQQLEAIGNYLGRDIVSEIDPGFLGHVGEPGLRTSSSGGRMTVAAAANYLEVEPNYTAEIIREFVERLIRKDNVDRGKVVEALDVLSNHKRQLRTPEEAAELQQIAEFVKESGYTPMIGSQSHPITILATLPGTPPGLRNIGNTCYLNSLLQYFYNVKLVRDLVLNFDDVKLELDEETVGQRRTGGNGTSVNLEEAIVARQFVEMLQVLFADLQITTEVAAQPSQKLANTALSSARDILDQQSQNVPPPLPARPSPAPPAIPHANDREADGSANEPVDLTVESVNDKLELASSQSSQTLVDDSEDVVMSATQPTTPYENASVSQSNDVQMEDVDESWSLDAKFAEVSRRLEHSDRSGTSQQDVGEIIGNILEHFMRAIRSDGPMPDKPDLQTDKITQTFFTTIVNYTIKTKKGYPTNDSVSRFEEEPLNVEIVPERWITAYPEEVDETTEGAGNSTDGASNARCTLVTALDRYFSYEPIDDGNRARYSSIRSLPPILHICIQRSTPKGKNKNPVIIPEILCLDRYMEAEKGSPVWLARKRTWALKERLKELETQSNQNNAKLSPAWTVALHSVEPEFKDFKLMDSQELQDMATSAIEKTQQDFCLDESFLNDVGLHTKHGMPSTPELFKLMISKVTVPASIVDDPLSDKLGDIIWDTSTPIEEVSREEIIELREKEETTFDSMQTEKYAIHAVICHRGGTAAGHYWVWIRDFKRNVWYRYNDETVTEDGRGTEAVLDDLNQTGDPYYVAYVRDEMKDDLVDVPQRRKPEHTGSSTGGQGVTTVHEVETIEGVAPDSIQASNTNGDS
ncbi:cysteine proteinase [Annulohypoxylon bovei var. microspora]|nr:cysteine proteinase [Annulohypoxylon bovei var. microspora]